MSERRSITQPSLDDRPGADLTSLPEVSVDPYVLPDGLPVPVDDGAADHLPGRRVPPLVLESSAGPVDLAELCAGLGVLYVYPRAGQAGGAAAAGLERDPGRARLHAPVLRLSRPRRRAARASAPRSPASRRRAWPTRSSSPSGTAMPFPVISDPELRLRDALDLPTFHTAGLELYKRLAIVARSGVIEKVFYPVFPPDRNAADVVAWLAATVVP